MSPFLLALFIILVGLMMILFSDKMLISHRCIRGLMSNLIKKSWTVSKLPGFATKYFPLFVFQEIRRNQDTNMSITLIHFTGINSKTDCASLLIELNTLTVSQNLKVF